MTSCYVNICFNFQLLCYPTVIENLGARMYLLHHFPCTVQAAGYTFEGYMQTGRRKDTDKNGTGNIYYIYIYTVSSVKCFVKCV